MKWTQSLIAEKIMEAKRGLDIECMPTRSQLNQYFGDTRLSNKVNKTHGYYGWAKILGLPIQANDTYTGKLAEEWAAEYLKKEGFSAEQMLQNYPFDLLVNGCVKVDVKFSNLYRNRDGDGFYSFALRKRVPTCDVYLLIAHGEDGSRTVFILPSSHVNQTQISIGEYRSIYHRYIDNFGCIHTIETALQGVS